MKIRAVLTALTVVLMSVPVFGQDLLARQAPTDKRMNALDSISLRRFLPNYGPVGGNSSYGIDFSGSIPSTNLYPEWNNKRGREYGVEIPKEYKIDVRRFCMPCDSRKVTSHFGYRPQFGRYHYGTDIKLYVGDTVRSVFSGKVRIVAYEAKGYGNYVIVRHDNGLETVYGHMSKHLVKENQNIVAGQPIGLGGNTGRSTGSHLHFETRFLGQYINPEHIFNFEAADAKGDYYVYRSNGDGNMIGSPRPAQQPGVYMATNATPSRSDVAESARPSSTTASVTGSVRKDVSREQTLQEKERKERELARLEKQRAEQKRKAEEQKKAAAKKNYCVKEGDTLYGIARSHGLSVSELCKKNRLSETAVIRPGQVLKCS